MSDVDSASFLTVLPGKNFSGRSRYLKSLVASEKRDENLYLGELATHYISGIFPTVKEEINLHLSKADKNTTEIIKHLFSIYGFEKHLNKNPFLLSGGEQTILALLCHLLLQPDVLAVDTTLEQLNEEWRIPVWNAIQKGDFPQTKVFLADNRLNEYKSDCIKNFSAFENNEIFKWKFNLPVVNDSIEYEKVSQDIQLNNLSFSYQKNEKILENICLKLESNNIYHLEGANGAGKSTLAKILCGILKINKQQLFINGKEFDAYKYPGQLAGYSFQNPDEQLFSSGIEKEILYPLKKEPADYTQRRENYIQMFGLQDIRNAHPSELPFVMRKRVALAATLAMDRPWYILDEPTLGQDDNFVFFLIGLLNNLTKRGKGIIIISHSCTLTNNIKCKKLFLQNKKITF
ncbi:MAG: ATP-binding cassette domain-containing protein [Dysgonamonadaceae bacterium]|jgi:energy-coupling factor transport system ATP-binding protein|nr:ATP-binding cassette domain-containing protein [Dysgonamonadaceae bacterium]